MYRRRWCWRWNHHPIHTDPLQHCHGMYCVEKANECLLWYDTMHEYHNVCWNGCPFLYHEDPRQHDQMQPTTLIPLFHMHVHNHTILLLNWQIGNTRSNPKSASLGQFTWCCCSSGTMPHTHSNTLIVVETTPHQRFVLYNYTFYTESGSILTFCFTFTEHPPRAVVLFLPSPTITNVAATDTQMEQDTIGRTTSPSVFRKKQVLDDFDDFVAKFLVRAPVSF